MMEEHVELPCPCVHVSFCSCVPELCQADNFVMHFGIQKLFGTNDHYGKKVCGLQEPCRWFTSQGHNMHLKFMHRSSVKQSVFSP